MLFLIIQHFLQPKEVLTGLLIQFLIDVLVDIDEPGNYDVLQSVDTTIGHLDLLVQC